MPPRQINFNVGFPFSDSSNAAQAAWCARRAPPRQAGKRTARAGAGRPRALPGPRGVAHATAVWPPHLSRSPHSTHSPSECSPRTRPATILHSSMLLACTHSFQNVDLFSPENTLSISLSRVFDALLLHYFSVTYFSTFVHIKHAAYKTLNYSN